MRCHRGTARRASSVDNSKKRGRAAGGVMRGAAGGVMRGAAGGGRTSQAEAPGRGVSRAWRSVGGRAEARYRSGECFDFLRLGGVVDEGGEEPREPLGRRDDVRAEERLVP
jgi:hypothetical protein